MKLPSQTHMIEQPRPLAGPSPKEIPLSKSPVVRVISQVTFPSILAIASEDKVAGFQEAIRDQYPFLREERIPAVHVDVATGTSTMRQEPIWRFADANVEHSWRVSLGRGYVALEAHAYKSRTDFLVRLRKVINATQKAFKPGEATRVGLRYVNRVHGEGFARLPELVNREVLGIGALNDALGASVVQMVTETMLIAKEGNITGRWGVLSPQSTYDGDALPPISGQSWVLDLDMFAPKPGPFAADEIVKQSTEFSQRIYSVFRQVVTDEFLRFYGGKP